MNVGEALECLNDTPFKRFPTPADREERRLERKRKEVIGEVIMEVFAHALTQEETRIILQTEIESPVAAFRQDEGQESSTLDIVDGPNTFPLRPQSIAYETTVHLSAAFQPNRP